MHLISKRLFGMFLVFVLYIGLVGAIWWELERVNKAVIEEAAIDVAASYIDLLASFRTLYTSEVISRLPKDQISVTHDYRMRKNSVPLPATLTMKLADEVSQYSEGFDVSLFSAYPFPWREPRKLDQFSQRAIRKLTADPNTPVVEFESVDEGSFLRYAEADLMREACIGCHNTHPETPKSDWKVGDVRGVLSVTVPITKTSRASSGALKDLLIIVVIVGILTLAIILRVILEESDQ